MAKKLSYADALKVLGKNDSELLDFAEKLTDGGLGALGVPNLFGLRELLVEKGRGALEGIGAKLRGESRLTRTERIEAAHRIIVVVSFLEALEERGEEVPLGWKEGKALLPAEHALDELVEDRVGLPAPTDLGSLSGEPVGDASGRANGDMFFHEFDSLAIAFSATPSGEPDDASLASVESAQERYREHLLHLASEVPEFAMWVHTAEHERSRQKLGTGLEELHGKLEGIASGRPVDTRRQELAAVHRATLDRNVIRAGDLPEGMRLPSLRDGYIPPRGQVTTAGPASVPSSEAWWDGQPAAGDLQSFFAAHLVHPKSTARPTVILGHPGAGKSKFTEMLAAQLPESDFLAIRIELRNVQPNSPIHVQIEDGLKGTLHDNTSWRELAESADGALPVIVLDGFDELLQATGVDRSDYLEQVQEFQQRQRSMGQPVAVVVTSRTVVADRTRFPLATTVVRLAPFDEGQMAHMLQVWNATNGAELSRRGLEPLTTDILLRYRELAEQPLLLMMLLIYDASGNALRQAAETLSHGQLYDRLLTRFAEREVEKHHASLNGDDFAEAVAHELRHLEVAALAMFSRRRQSVRAEDLGSDLAVLMPEAFESEHDTGLHGRISPAHQVLGRFFFVHEARARRSDGSASVFEFLHATFGEYLVARTVAEALDDLVDEHAGGSRRRRRRKHGPQRIDDGELYAYASFASFAGRQKVVEFLAELLDERFEEEPEARDEYSDLLVDLYREAPFPAPNRSYTEYEPARLPLTRREGNYTSNLVLLMVLVEGGPVDLTRLHRDAEVPEQAWHATAALWRRLPGSEWAAILATLRVRHAGIGQGEDYTMTIELERGGKVNVGECIGFYLHRDVDQLPVVNDPYGLSVPFAGQTSHLLRSTGMRVNGSAARLVVSMLPYLQHVSPDLGNWYTDAEVDRLWSEPHELLQLLLSHDTGRGHVLRERLTAYRRLLAPSRPLGRAELLALRQVSEDLASHMGDERYDHTRAHLRTYLEQLSGVPDGHDPQELESVLERARAVAGLHPDGAWLLRLVNGGARSPSPDTGREGPRASGDARLPGTSDRP
ncbi:hypothetical protein IDM40_03345 [Nocardiopsis sp. HNM0947]|uniref:AAA+ ATPase domain-containing protein n=1 Tax=Nocardiopsis coralli TaxID=2772213 RepID=A0ABR9P1Q7_9ACTN|nr:hypothetical protein [Nocardiopsis coralli]MBE2997747.1 hypothetical protein [Nocardiopsis coralli]